MDKTCTPEEIEKKRLLALQRRQQSQLKAQSTPTSSQIHQQSKLNDNENIAQQNKTNLNDNENIARQNKTNNRFNPIEPRRFFNPMLSVTGKCYMISDDRFALELSAFVPEIIDIFKTVPSRIYDPKSRIWNFHLNDYNGLLKTLSSNHCNLSITKIPEAVLRIFKKNLKSDTQLPEHDLSKIDETLTNALMPFQREGICYGISKNGRCIIADDMGLGKTIQALGIAHYYKESWPLLIVTPSSVRYQWSQAIYEFLPSIPTHYIHHFANTKDHIGDDKITITSYDLLVRAINTFAKHIYGFVILDESHGLKSNKTARFQATNRICTHARHIVLLTGTPALSRPVELYTQISLANPRFMSYEDYGIRYCAGQRSIFGWDFLGSSNSQELQALLKSDCMIRRLKADVLNQLPSKIRKVIILDSSLIKTGKQMREMSQRLQTNITGLERHSTLIQYYNQSSYARVTAVRNYVAKLFENKKKCLLYGHHQIILDTICEAAESVDIAYIRIDGKTNSEQRKLLIDKFQECDECLVAVLSITAVNAGVTLTAANLVVFTELFWNPGILSQAEDRVHRIGQNNTVTIEYLIAQNTVDDYLWPLLHKKKDVLNALGLKQDLSINNIAVAVQNNKQQNLDSFLNISSSSEKGSQLQYDMEISPAIPEASPSNVKELLEVDDECFDSCDWDTIV
ncbi:SWI/SNF-related matrix-associated actin-dependent regulator of chromatin subfamily A-like protein 1 [Mycetomoellerius zeteki]|uniref:SWI/SNF-related matrix-associated actin-dependent regulator of chromatin subfamily A-like protein 1 n=1 Tax=Mycetomoellerius zeteki TaxID=64791 RepID=UPI00084E5DA6|nr:PREDICTED: SWI/SNF-related matrix-associated actin-dependent regulator of chromatin subfamily A-like protein 1 [Trachymyrmex zeteki]